jgi:hypothetical protein
VTRRKTNLGGGSVVPSQKARDLNVRNASVSTRPGGRCPIIGLTALLAVWVLGGTTAAQPRPDVTLWIPADSVPPGEPFALMIESSTPAHRGIAFPPATADSVFGSLEVLRRSDVYTRRVGGGYAIDSVSYTVQTSARDSIRIPPVPIRVDAAVGTLTTFTEPRAVWIADDPDSFTSSARAQKGSSRLPGVGWMLVGLVAAGVGGSYLWYRSRENHSSQEASPSTESPATGEATSPHESAIRRLDALQSSDLSTSDDVEAFYVTLADVLRTYLSRRWALATEERTTQELMTLLDRRTDVPPSAIEQLRHVLEQSDRVKFAGVRPDSSTAEEALHSARTVLNLLEEASSPGPASSASATGQSE